MRAFLLLVFVLLASDCEAQLFRRTFRVGQCNCIMCRTLRAGLPWPPRATAPLVVSKPVYAPTPHYVVAEALRVARLKPGMLFVDLGSGDGRVAVRAAWLYGCHAVGVDLDPEKVKEGRELAKTYGVEQLVRFYQLDVARVKLSNVDVVYAYLEEDTMNELLPRFKTMRRGAKLISYQHNVKRLMLQYYDTKRRLFMWTNVADSIMEGRKDEDVEEAFVDYRYGNLVLHGAVGY